MQSEFLEIGQIVNTHGIRGEVKLVPWADSPEFVCQFNTLYADGAPLKVTSARVHKGNVIAKLEGVDDVNAAKLPEGSFFLADLIGLDVVDEHGQKLGVLREVLSPSRQLVYVVEGDREIMIPAVPEFILETNIPEGYVKVRLIEGM